MKVLLTGATGFIGSHLLRGLLRDAHDVLLLKREDSQTRRVDDILDRCHVYDTNRTELADVFAAHPDIDAVIHAATSYGHNEPLSATLSTNVLFPLKLLEAFAQAVRGGVFINTDSCFTKNPLDCQYLRSYTKSKKQLLEWARLALDGAPVALINMRLEHPYGPEDAVGKFVPHIIQQCLSEVSHIDLTAGEQKRDFIHVNDVVDAYLTVLRNDLPLPGEYREYEVGNGSAITIRELVETIRRLSGARTRLNFGALPYRAGEIMHSAADISGLASLGFKPSIDLEAGLFATLNAINLEHGGDRSK